MIYFIICEQPLNVEDIHEDKIYHPRICDKMNLKYCDKMNKNSCDIMNVNCCDKMNYEHKEL